MFIPPDTVALCHDRAVDFRFTGSKESDSPRDLRVHLGLCPYRFQFDERKEVIQTILKAPVTRALEPLSVQKILLHRIQDGFPECLLCGLRKFISVLLVLGKEDTVTLSDLSYRRR